MNEQGSIQKITFGPIGDSFIARIVTNNVEITPSKNLATTSSSGRKYDVEMKEMLDFCWDAKFYPALVAVHYTGAYMAYVADISREQLGVVKVISQKSTSKLTVKPPQGGAAGIDFAFTTMQILLAIIDKKGEVYIHSIKEDENDVVSFKAELLLHIRKPSDIDVNGLKKLVWCPFVSEDETVDQDLNQLLCVAMGNKVHIWNVAYVNREHKVSTIVPGGVESGFLEIEFAVSVINLAFSPDASTICLTTVDGYLRFFQIEMMEVPEAKYLHEFKPHNGKPVIMLHFLDNFRTEDAEDQFWKYMVTGTENNSEIKVWSCETWQCVQTIVFRKEDFGINQLQSSIDLTGRYLSLYDMDRRVLFVLHVNKTERTAMVDYVCQFLLPENVLNVKLLDSLFHEQCTSTEEADGDGKMELKLLTVHLKLIQECIVRYNPNVAMSPVFSHTLPQSGDTPNSVGKESLLKDAKRNSFESYKVTTQEFLDAVRAEKSLLSDQNVDSAISIRTTVHNGGLVEEEVVMSQEDIERRSSFQSGGTSPGQEVVNIFVSDEEDEGELDIEKEFATPISPQVATEYQDNLTDEGKAKKCRDQTRLSMSAADKQQLDEITASLKTVSVTVEGLQQAVESLLEKDTHRVTKLNEVHDTVTKVKRSLQGTIDAHKKTNEVIKQQRESLVGVSNDLREMKSVASDYPRHIAEELKLDQGKILDDIRKNMATGFNELLKSPPVVETICNSLVSSLVPVMKTLINDLFQRDIMPKFDEALQGMFDRLNEQFVLGTEQLISKYEAVTDKKISELTNTLSTCQIDNLKEVAVLVENHVLKKADIVFDKIELKFIELLGSVMEQQKVALNDVIARGSRASSPDPDSNRRAQLLQLVSQGKLDSAFRKALSYRDEKVLLFLCSKLKSQVVFSNPSAFKPQTLLSLLEQLSGGEWGTNLDLKYRYMQGAVMILDKHDPAIKDDLLITVPIIKNRLKSRISSIPATHAGHQNLKMLLMAVESLLAKDDV